MTVKEKVKIWSRRRLLGAFLAFLGLSAVATAQNGTVDANCGGKLVVVTRTAQQMMDGTTIPISFTSGVTSGDLIYFVANGVNGDNGGQGHLRTLPCGGTITIGENLQIGTVSDGTFTPSANANTVTDNVLTPNAGIAYDQASTVTVKATNINSSNDRGTYYLGVFINDADRTQCFSDVYYIEIQVLPTIYASLTLNNGNPYEYICNDGTTQTDLGFSLCHLPAGGTLNYKVTATNADSRGVIVGSGANGLQIASTGNTDNGTPAAVPLVAGTPSSASLAISPEQDNTYRVKIGTQQLINNSNAIAGELTFAFTDMTYTYTVDERSVTLPVVFENENANCNIAENFYEEFTVYVAPNFNVQTLAYKTAERNEQDPDFTFCQGTIAYLNSTTSATEGTITNWTWSVTGTSANSTEAGAKIGDGANTPLLAYTANAEDYRTESRVQVGQLTDIATGVYRYTLVGKWDIDNSVNDQAPASNFYDTIRTNGCTATQSIEIQVTPAPILHIATNENTEGDGIWNATDVITNAEVCSGDEIKILTADALGTIGTSRQDTLNTSIYIKTNGASIAYTIDPADNNALKAYSVWRSTPADATGTLSIGNADGTTPTPGHYLNNETANNPAIITYIVENAGTNSNTCALVKSDGTSLNLGEENEGKVRIQFPVKARPQFQLGAN